MTRREYSVEMQTREYEWLTPIRIFASSDRAAESQARKLIDKHDAIRTRLYGTIEHLRCTSLSESGWGVVTRFHGRHKTLWLF